MAVRADLNGILDRLKTIFDAANTTTASPVDLSSGMSRRVQKVLTVNPELVWPQATFFPFVTSFIDEKVIEGASISHSQLDESRRASVTLTVVGGVFNQNITDVTKDQTDRDAHLLMENIELTLRNDPSLSGLVKWQRPESVKYFSGRVQENSHLRAGYLTLKAWLFY